MPHAWPLAGALGRGVEEQRQLRHEAEGHRYKLEWPPAAYETEKCFDALFEVNACK